MHPQATEHIPQIIKIIQELIDKGLAYRQDGDVYSAAGFRSYGKLSGQDMEELEEGARVSVDEDKRSPLTLRCGRRRSPGSPVGTAPGKGAQPRLAH